VEEDCGGGLDDEGSEEQPLRYNLWAPSRHLQTPGLAAPQAPPRSSRPQEPSPVTVAYDSHVLVVVAVVDAPAVAPALAQGCLLALAVHVVQEDGSAPLAEGHGSREGDSVAAAQLATHHVGIHNVPVVIADRPPGAVVEDLHSPLAPAGPIGEPYLWEHGQREVRQQVTSPRRDREVTNTRWVLRGGQEPSLHQISAC